MRYFTSDLHFAHTNIIKYTNRPYESVEEMNLDLIRRWNDRVTPDDEVWVLGDFAMGKLADSLPLALQLNGHKILIPGNHDRCWVGHTRGAEWVEKYEAVGFILRPSTMHPYDWKEVLFDHFPYTGDSSEDDRYIEYRHVDTGKWLLHGHVHNLWRQSGRQINVGIDAWGGYPVSAEELRHWIEAGEADLPPLEWVPA